MFRQARTGIGVLAAAIAVAACTSSSSEALPIADASGDAAAEDGGPADAAALDAELGDGAAGAEVAVADAAAAVSPADAGGEAPPPTMPSPYQLLGGAQGIRGIMADFIFRVTVNPKINGLFRNTSMDAPRLIECLTLQMSSLTGGPQTYPTTTSPEKSAGCRTMKHAHAGLGISRNDYNDLTLDLTDAFRAAHVPEPLVAAFIQAVSGDFDDIVEDPGNDRTVFQRIGRMPTLNAAIGKFVATVLTDPAINGFFSGLDTNRFKVCLVRQLCAVDGPCKYGEEVDSWDVGVSRSAPCRDMLSVHAGMTSSGRRAAGGRMITRADFDRFLGHLVAELAAAGVPAADQTALLGALTPLCKQIVAGAEGC